MRIFDTTLDCRGLQKCCGKAFHHIARNQGKEVDVGDVVTCPECLNRIVLGQSHVWRKVERIQNSVITGIECSDTSNMAGVILRGVDASSVKSGDLLIRQ